MELLAIPITSDIKEANEIGFIPEYSIKIRQNPPIDIQIVAVSREIEKCSKKGKNMPKIRLPLDEEESEKKIPLSKRALEIAEVYDNLPPAKKEKFENFLKEM